MDRRRFLVAVAATVAVTGISWSSANGPKDTVARADVLGSAPSPVAPPPPKLLPPPDPASRVTLPGGAALSKLPGNNGDLLAWTVDDGVDTDVVRLYTQFAKDTGVRLTYFVTGVFRSWTENARLLRPLVESGQIQLANHTWTHPDLTKLSPKQIADELNSTDVFLRNTYGVDAAPYFRPPYGHHSAVVDAVAADLGYQVPTLWNGDLRDSAVLSEDQIVKMADQYFTRESIVIGHLNHAPVTRVYGHLVEIIRARRLRTVTLNDVFLRPEIPYRTPSFAS
ncbi:MAG: polysaccharide deacetylase family protein [Actinomycetota bacterium]|uniref:Polysaccharide deacetylase family protein n=1 Tax=Mycobacterium lentiflavum TaxID=141349 RepID=A0ABY3V5V4_MYCLN|nr:polysaccharide deacetylase family protein [Mycobacterium lentiflavum]MEE3066155.1 polysaccharide deacetylase family protein [Actinomycetota bacterium]ULP45013.1 polysaccharide deacetylase family protein [Mycobacterium lentiflavum]